MKTFRCSCGNRTFFENTHCVSCGAPLGFDPARLDLRPLKRLSGGLLEAPDGHLYRPCRNTTEYGVCNWLVDAGSDQAYCDSCDLTRTIPALDHDNNLALWGLLEEAKRRLVYTLLVLGLPVVSRRVDPDGGLGFDFLEDRGRNPAVREEHVLTGHAHGVITLNVKEADHLARETERHRLGETYRTPLGHLRHESGHYYFERMVYGTSRLAEFRALFGNEQADYGAALERHYAAPPKPTGYAYISAYAMAHPLEDWAECWAHYLHMMDTLETAAAFHLLDGAPSLGDFDHAVTQWLNLGIALNALNRSLGMLDPYPFVLTRPVVEKLRFLHQLVHPS